MHVLGQLNRNKRVESFWLKVEGVEGVEGVEEVEEVNKKMFQNKKSFIINDEITIWFKHLFY